MKFCSKCGKEVFDDAVICPHCGCAIGNIKANESRVNPASLILGIIGILVAWLFALAGHVVSIIGIVLGAKEYKKNGSKVGLVLSIIGEVCSIISSLLGVLLLL